ncbi:MAG: hypothetical protein AAGU11_14470 [Syntrophobacteraceae bacterium]
MADVAVLAAGNEEKLSEFTAFQDLPENVGIILVLPDRKPNLIMKGDALRPRLVAFGNEDLSAVGAVVRRISKHLVRNYAGQESVYNADESTTSGKAAISLSLQTRRSTKWQDN